VVGDGKAGISQVGYVVGIRAWNLPQEHCLNVALRFCCRIRRLWLRVARQSLRSRVLVGVD